MGKCRRTGLISDDYLPLFLASLEVRPFKVLGCLGVDLDLDPWPLLLRSIVEARDAEKARKVASNLAGLGVVLAELADELAEQAGLPSNGWAGLGWLAAGLKSIGRDLWGERERVREGEGRHDTTRHDTAGTGRMGVAIDRPTGKHALAGGTDWNA